MGLLDFFRQSPLHRAVLENSEERLRSALSSGAHFTKVLGCSPLQLAHFLGHAACARVLGGASSPRIKFSDCLHKAPQLISPKEFERETGVVYEPHLRIASLRVLGHGLRLCRRGRRRFLTQERRFLAALFRTDIERGFVADVSVRWIDGDLGYGVFAEAPIKAFSLIGAYTGRLDFRPLWRFALNEYRFYYETCGWTLRPLTVDAKEGGNVTRFVNHSDDPNCEAVYVPYGGLVQIAFRSKSAISPGEQLFINYGADFWEAHHIKKRHLSLSC